jgi:hypothetical protein
MLSALNLESEGRRDIRRHIETFTLYDVSRSEMRDRPRRGGVDVYMRKRCYARKAEAKPATALEFSICCDQQHLDEDARCSAHVM